MEVIQLYSIFNKQQTSLRSARAKLTLSFSI